MILKKDIDMTEILKIGKKAPAFTLPDAEKKKHSLKDFSGSWLILYFYPKDNTPGCTIEAVDFTCKASDFKKRGAEVIGISPDSSESHGKFITKQNLDITLLSDIDKKVCEKYGVWQLKKMMGKEYMGVVRTTYLIDPTGKIVHVWPKVKVKGHVDAVIEKLEELQ